MNRGAISRPYNTYLVRLDTLRMIRETLQRTDAPHLNLYIAARATHARKDAHMIFLGNLSRDERRSPHRHTEHATHQHTLPYLADTPEHTYADLPHLPSAFLSWSLATTSFHLETDLAQHAPHRVPQCTPCSSFSMMLLMWPRGVREEDIVQTLEGRDVDRTQRGCRRRVARYARRRRK